MTEEHVIPEAVGGRLTVDFLCGKCNSNLGARHEALVRIDPTVRLLANELTSQIPKLVAMLSEGQRVVGIGPDGRSPGYIRKGEFVVESHAKEDGSLIQPTPIARRTVDTILKRAGYDSPFRTEAIALLDSAPDNERVTLAPGLDVVKWETTALELSLNGPLLDPLVPAKVAFEFLACHLGSAVYEDDPPLVEARRTFKEGTLDSSWISVERLEAPKAQPFHGVAFEGNSPWAKVQLRLFGKLAFRIHFRRLAVHGPRAQYTHDLVTNKEWIAQIGEQRASA
jgi:hypothetical protein